MIQQAQNSVIVFHFFVLFGLCYWIWFYRPITLMHVFFLGKFLCGICQSGYCDYIDTFLL